MSNFERAIEHVEAASKRWGFITVFLAFERPSRLQWTRLHPLACYDSVGSATNESKSVHWAATI